MIEINPQRTVLQQPRQSTSRPDGKSTDHELTMLEDILLKKDQDIAKEVAIKKVQHQKWNTEYVDWTNHPLTPPISAIETAGFRRATTDYLPTPPASISDEEEHPGEARGNSVNIRYGSIDQDPSSSSHHSYRRRIGRGGRMIIDRRALPIRNKPVLDPRVAELFKYDDPDNDDMQYQDLNYSDSYDLNNMRYRAAVCANASAHTITRHIKTAVEQATSSASSSQPPNPTNSQTGTGSG